MHTAEDVVIRHRVYCNTRIPIDEAPNIGYWNHWECFRGPSVKSEIVLVHLNEGFMQFATYLLFSY